MDADKKQEIKQEAERKKIEAKQKAQLAKLAAKDAQARRKAPQYYEFPAQTGDPEVDSVADLTALEDGWRKKIGAEGKRFELATDSEYWACVCFQTREQKEAFLSAINVLWMGDKYIDGQAVAEKLGISLPPADVPYNASEGVVNRWEEFTMR